MTELALTLLPYKVLASHLVFVLSVFIIVFRRSWGKEIFQLIGKYSLFLTFLVSLAAVVGSLFYSEIIGYEACVLCWWQRIFLYPILIISGIALYKKDSGVFKYIVPLAVLAGIVALYQAYANFGGASLLSCTSAEGACSKIYVKEFGYITIPTMSLTISLYILLLAWIRKVYDKNSNA